MILENLKTKFLAQNIIHLEKIDSTQKYIRKAENLLDGTLVVTDFQTNGIGTHDRRWISGEKENIIISFVLNPKCNISKLTNITVILAESMIKAIQNTYKIKLDIKIPNDIVYNNKKLGGILTESIIEGEIAKKIYVGIGINLNEEKFPEEIKDIATSLKIEFKNEYSREKILSEFLNIFEQEYLKMIK